MGNMIKVYYNYTDERLEADIIGDWYDFIQPTKDILKPMRYMWDGNKKVWFKQVIDIQHEIDFFNANFNKTELSILIDPKLLDYNAENNPLTTNIKRNFDEWKHIVKDSLSSEIKKCLMKHQKEGVIRFINQGMVMLLGWDMGTGKSFGGLAIIKALNKKGLLILPKNLMTQWRDEIIKWKVANYNEVFIFPDGPNLKFIPTDSKYYIINYEKLRFLSKYKDIKDLSKLLKKDRMILEWLNMLDHQEFICVYDEAYKIKNYKSQLYIAHKKIQHELFKWFGRVVLTGTPMENSLMEFYTIINFTKPFSITWDMMEKHFIYRPNLYEIRYKNLDLFNKMANKIMHRVTKEMVKDDLPKFTQMYRFVEHSKKAEKIVETLKQHAGGIFEIYSTLRVIDSYLEPHEDLKYYNVLKKFGILEHTEKYNELLNILEEIGGNKILIFTSFSKTMHWLVNKLNKLGYKSEGVDANIKDKDSVKERFVNGDTQIVIATSVWERGVDIPNKVNYMVNYDFPINPANYAQRINRIYRINSKEPKTIINLISNIIELDVYEIVKNKIENIEKAVEGNITQKQVMSALSEKWGMPISKKKEM